MRVVGHAPETLNVTGVQPGGVVPAHERDHAERHERVDARVHIHDRVDERGESPVTFPRYPRSRLLHRRATFDRPELDAESARIALEQTRARLTPGLGGGSSSGCGWPDRHRMQGRL